MFTAAGVLVFFAAPGGRVGGAVVFSLFGFCAAIGAVQLVVGSTLVLTPEGFTVNAFGRRVLRRWDSVGPFYVIRPNVVLLMVEFSPPAGFGMGALPDTYGMKASDLAGRRNEWRERYGTRQSSPVH